MLFRPCIRRFVMIKTGGFEQAASLREEMSNVQRKAWKMVYF